MRPNDHVYWIDFGIFSHQFEKMMKLDDLDRKILREVQRDCAASVEELGDKVGLSRNACWRRVKQLEEAGVIRARVALADPVALGCALQVFIMVRASSHDPEWLETFKRATSDLDEIVGVYRMTGDLDYLIRARVEDIADYDRLYQQLIRRAPMSDVSASFVMEEIKETTALPV